VAVLLIAGMVGWAVYASQRSDEFKAPPSAVADGTAIPVGSGPVKVDLYVDFMCPHCKEFEEQSGSTLDQLVADGKITINYHPIAILDRASSTNYSTRASAASGCAADGGKFKEYAAALFAQQPPEGGEGLSDDKLISIGGSAGLSDSFGTCVRDGRYKTWPEHVTDDASRRGVNGTPTVYVAGKQIQPTTQALTAAVAAAS
jgi:protein-disulfide isomerase